MASNGCTGSIPVPGTGLTARFFRWPRFIYFSPGVWIDSTLEAARTWRLELHASKEFRKSFTTRADDWELHLSIDVLDNTKARLIENHIKRMKSRAYIENLKKYPELVQKLVAKYS